MFFTRDQDVWKVLVVEVSTRRPLEEHKLAVHLTCREQARPHTGHAGPEGGATRPVVCHGPLASLLLSVTSIEEAVRAA